jgi:para-aminobenzoate synthetase component 1
LLCGFSFLEIKGNNMTIEQYQQQIKEGNTYLANLTTKTHISTNYSLEKLYNMSNAKFKLYFKDKFICFSPERFIQCKDNKVFTYPMKGTINANIKNAKNIILNNKKELAEHTMIVDLLRNDLSIISSNVKVDKFRYCETIITKDKKLIQTSSKISGTLEKNWQNKIGDILISVRAPVGDVNICPFEYIFIFTASSYICASFCITHPFNNKITNPRVNAI